MCTIRHSSFDCVVYTYTYTLHTIQIHTTQYMHIASTNTQHFLLLRLIQRTYNITCTRHTCVQCTCTVYTHLNELLFFSLYVSYLIASRTDTIHLSCPFSLQSSCLLQLLLFCWFCCHLFILRTLIATHAHTYKQQFTFSTQNSR